MNRAEARRALVRVIDGEWRGNESDGDLADHLLDAISFPSSDGVLAFWTERDRQITDEGYAPAGDIGRSAQLALAAYGYVAHAAATLDRGFTPSESRAAGLAAGIPEGWPWARHCWNPTGYPQRDLVKAGALLAAAFDAFKAERAPIANTQEEYPAAISAAFDAAKGKCQDCLGDGRIAGGTEDRDPWPVWAALPPGSDLAVQIGVVYPITCTACDGTGEKP